MCIRDSRAPAARAAHQKRASLKRFSSLRSEKAKPFASDWRNWVDLAAVLPLYVSLLTRRAKWTRSLGVLRMLRCFKITSSYTATQVLAVTLKNVARPLALPLFFLAVSALVCGSILFLLEPCALQEVCTFEGLWEAIYFVLVGMTTVGYGDMVPVTACVQIKSSTRLQFWRMRQFRRDLFDCASRTR